MRAEQERPIVMIVEDEFLLATQLDMWLKSSGMTPLGPVASLTAAADLLDIYEQPDAALLDVNLRGQLIYPIVDMLEARGVPYMFVTGRDRTDLPFKYRDAPILRKPVIKGTLITSIQALISKSSGENAVS